MSEPTPAQAYKAVTGRLVEAAEELRERERTRAVELAVELVALEEAKVRALDQAAGTRIGVALQWDDVVESLWPEAWLTLRPRPDPAPDPRRAAELAELTTLMETRSAELQAAVRRRRFGLPRR